MNRKAQKKENKEWRDLERGFKASQAEYGKLGHKRDPADALDKWECERSTLNWMIERTPATTLRGLRVKALALQARSGRPGRITLSERRTPEIELAEEIVRGVLALGKAA